MSIRMPDLLRGWLRDKAARDGVTVHSLVVRAVSELRERDHAAPASSAGSGSPDAIDST
jgi:hypothetical protein